MKKKYHIIYDIIIYGCLLLAIFFLVLGGKDYFTSLKEPSTIKTELNSALNEIKGSNENELIIEDLEPESLREIDKKPIINNYLDSILDQKIVDDKITYEMISTWHNYEIINATYLRQITDNYYVYQVDIKINNASAKLPTTKNESLSKDNYVVITLNVNILNQGSNSEYIVKSIDIPKES